MSKSALPTGDQDGHRRPATELGAEALSRRRFLGRLTRAGAAGLALGVVGGPARAAAAGVSPALPASAYGADVAAEWFDLALRLVRTTPGFSPPVASRAFAYAGVTLYEAVVPGMRDHRSLASALADLAPLPPPRDLAYHWPTVANAALAAILRSLFPTASPANRAAIDELEDGIGALVRPGVAPGVERRSVARGRMVAEHVFHWSKTDGGHEAYLHNFPPYTPPTGPGLWVPTPPGFLPALQPYWGANRPFALASGAACEPGPPTPYSEDPASAFHAEAREVYETAVDLSPEQAAIARFWSDDPGTTATPPGHSISILTQVLREHDLSLAVAAEAYAKVGMAVADAFIACWHTKYRDNLLRPITYIRALIDPDWTPLLTTPPFPEYTSGHSVQSGAAAQVLTDLFGDVAFVDHTHDARGLPPRAFDSFFEAAEEAAISRLYGGIHFRPAIALGVEQGKCVGGAVSGLPFRR